MPIVLLGNTAVTVPVDGAQGAVNGESIETVNRPDLGQQITTAHLPSGLETAEALSAVIDVWRGHSSADPAWVESEDPVLAEAVAAHFGCPVGCPDNGDPDVHNHDTWKEG